MLSEPRASPVKPRGGAVGAIIIIIWKIELVESSNVLNF